MPKLRLPSVFALSLLVSLPSSVLAADAPAPEAARVEIQLRDADGNQVEMIGQNLAWNQTHLLRESEGDHQYGVSIAMKRGEGDKLTVALSYELDGAMVVERHDVRAKLAERVSIASKGGEAQVVFVIKAEPPRGKLDVGGSDDPLAGM